MNPLTSNTPTIRDVVVVGAGPTGLTTALLLARAGLDVLLLDRDQAAPGDGGETAWTTWCRPGVNQFRQVHVALPRWYQIMTAELPEIPHELRRLGGSELNLLHLHPGSLTRGWQEGDERFGTVTGRRPVIEAAIASSAASEPRLSVRRGVRVTGLALRRAAGDRPRVVGVRTADETIPADLVVDAGGHRTPVPGWLAEHGAAPTETRSSVGLTYYTRHYHSPDGPPTGTGGALTHHDSYSVLTLPADNGTWGLALVVSSADRALRRLREATCWESALRASGLDEHWLNGEPIEDVRPLAGLQDVVRDYAPGGVPEVDGLVAVGDAWVTTSPFLGRGLSLGAMQAVALRDAVSGSAGPTASAGPEVRYARLLHERVKPYVDATLAFGRHRVAELTAEAAGLRYATDDRGWAGTLALLAGTRHDPTLLRAHTMIGSLLALPAEIFADPEIAGRVGRWLGTPPYPPERPGRAALVGAVATEGLSLPVGLPTGVQIG